MAVSVPAPGVTPAPAPGPAPAPRPSPPPQSPAPEHPCHPFRFRLVQRGCLIYSSPVRSFSLIAHSTFQPLILLNNRTSAVPASSYLILLTTISSYACCVLRLIGWRSFDANPSSPHGLGDVDLAVLVIHDQTSTQNMKARLGEHDRQKCGGDLTAYAQKPKQTPMRRWRKWLIYPTCALQLASSAAGTHRTTARRSIPNPLKTTKTIVLSTRQRVTAAFAGPLQKSSDRMRPPPRECSNATLST